MTEIRDASTAATNAGLKGLATGDQEAQAHAVADYINNHGGILGRKVVLVFDNHQNAQVASQPEAEAQASCARFTQDNPVVAVINTQTGLDTPSLRACLAKAGIALFGVTISPIDDATLTTSKGLFFPTLVPTWNRFAPVFAHRLAVNGFFHSWDDSAGAPGAMPVKLGAYIHQDAASEAAFQLASAAFKAQGHPIDKVFRYSNYNEASNAVLQFRAAGITHVFGTDNFFFLFMIQAETQHYRPRYALHTGNAPGVLMEPNTPAAQLAGALGVGSAPTLDINHATGPITPGDKRCRAIFASAGQDFTNAYFTEAFAFSICDSLLALRDADNAGRGFTPSYLHAGMGLIGPHFTPAATFASALSMTYSVIPGAGRDLAFQPGCRCFNYIGQSSYRYG